METRAEDSENEVSSLTLPTPQTSSKNRVLWKWSLGFTLAFALLLVWRCGTGVVEGRRLANAAVDHFHNQLNDERYSEIYTEADDAFRSAGGQEEVLKFLEAVHAKLGISGSCSLRKINVTATPQGTLIVTVYNAAFTRGTAIETFTWKKEGTTLLLRGYNVQSKTFIVN